MPIRLAQVGNRLFWPVVGFESMLKIASHSVIADLRGFQESAQAKSNPTEPD